MKQERKQTYLRVTLRVYIEIYLNHLGRQKHLLQAITNPLFFVRHVTHVLFLHSKTINLPTGPEPNKQIEWTCNSNEHTVYNNIADCIINKASLTNNQYLISKDPTQQHVSITIHLHRLLPPHSAGGAGRSCAGGTTTSTTRYYGIKPKRQARFTAPIRRADWSGA